MTCGGHYAIFVWIPVSVGWSFSLKAFLIRFHSKEEIEKIKNKIIKGERRRRRSRRENTECWCRITS